MASGGGGGAGGGTLQPVTHIFLKIILHSCHFLKKIFKKHLNDSMVVFHPWF